MGGTAHVARQASAYSRWYCTCGRIGSCKVVLHMCTALDPFTFVFVPVLTWIYLFGAENCSEHQNKTIFGSNQVNSGENGEKHKSKQTISCHVLA